MTSSTPTTMSPVMGFGSQRNRTHRSPVQWCEPLVLSRLNLPQRAAARGLCAAPLAVPAGAVASAGDRALPDGDDASRVDLLHDFPRPWEPPSGWRASASRFAAMRASICSTRGQSKRTNSISASPGAHRRHRGRHLSQPHDHARWADSSSRLFQHHPRRMAPSQGTSRRAPGRVCRGQDMHPSARHTDRSKAGCSDACLGAACARGEPPPRGLAVRPWRSHHACRHVLGHRRLWAGG
jgi:hypothetical protein